MSTLGRRRAAQEDDPPEEPECEEEGGTAPPPEDACQEEMDALAAALEDLDANADDVLNEDEMGRLGEAGATLAGVG